MLYRRHRQTERGSLSRSARQDYVSVWCGYSRARRVDAYARDLATVGSDFRGVFQLLGARYIILRLFSCH